MLINICVFTHVQVPTAASNDQGTHKHKSIAKWKVLYVVCIHVYLDLSKVWIYYTFLLITLLVEELFGGLECYGSI